MRWILFIMPILALSLSACVTKQQYDALKAERDYQAREAQSLDSLRYAYQQISNQLRNSEAQLREATLEQERLIITNQNQQRDYQDLLNRYNQLLEDNFKNTYTSAYEKLDMQKQLAAQQDELDQKARDLAVMEYELTQREAKLSALAGSYDNIQGSLAERNRRIMELETMLQNNQFAINTLQGSISNALVGFSSSDLKVEEKNGKLYVSLSQDLLFKSGSDDVDYKGKQALQKLAEVLKKNPDIDITVEGHTDNVGNAASNWDLSVKRATSVVKTLTAYGVEPERVTAAGRAFYVPLASNATATGKAQNRRTEIILSPKLDQLYQLLDR